MTGAHKAAACVLLAWLSLALALWPSSAWPSALALQADQTIEVGSGPIGERTMSLAGRASSDGETMSLYGYPTAVTGLGQEALFGDGGRSVESARFTLVADLAIDEAENRADVTMTGGSGELRIYFDEGAGARWDDPGSFADGQLVATYALSVQETRQHQAPGVGVVVADGALTQQTAEEFTVSGGAYRFGAEGITQRLRYVGAQVAATEAESSLATFTGWITVSQRESVVVVLGSPGAATPAASGDACAAIDSWLAQTNATLDDVGGLAADVGPDVDLATLDVAALRADAERAAELVAAQRDLAVPEAAAEAHRLAVTATSTTARGLQLLADAADQGDADLQALGQAALRDGAELSARAADAITAVGAACS